MKRLNRVAQFVCLSEKLQPTRAYATDSGLDVRANLKSDAAVQLQPGDRYTFDTGCHALIPKVPFWVRKLCQWVLGADLTIELQVRPKSGLGSLGISIVNSPGTIDNGYIGEIQVLIINLSRDVLTITQHQKIAQVVFAPVLLYTPKNIVVVADPDEDPTDDPTVAFDDPVNAVYVDPAVKDVPTLLTEAQPDNERGVNGFGSSGSH